MAEMIRVFNEIHATTAGLSGQRLARQSGFPPPACTAIHTAILEIARNMLLYAGRGSISISIVQEAERIGLQVLAVDHGPGISDISAALQDGYSTSGGIGRGLPGAKRLMDQFEIVSQPGGGTSITMTKWKA
jgi:serine/threonine-protein kinase RsbT